MTVEYSLILLVGVHYICVFVFYCIEDGLGMMPKCSGPFAV